LEAKPAYRQAIEIQERLAADHPQSPQYRQNLALTQNNLASVLEDLGEREAAEAGYRRSLELREKLATDYPKVIQYRQDLADSYTSLGILLKDRQQWAAADQSLRRAMEINEQLVAEVPAMRDHRVGLAGAYVNLGELLRQQRQFEPSLDWQTKAIAILEPLTREGPKVYSVEQFLRNAHWRRAQALDQLARHAEALIDWNRAKALNFDNSPEVRLGRAKSLARNGEHAKAVAEGKDLLTAKGIDAVVLCELAGIWAIAAAAARKPPNSNADAPGLADQYAIRSVDLLRQAVQKGYKDIERLKTDEDLAAIRTSEDFAKLIRELQAREQ
jgi:tetratricopeptide (TPR) repeat protein